MMKLLFFAVPLSHRDATHGDATHGMAYSEKDSMKTNSMLTILYLPIG